ncbi:MAG: hypothetical protein EBR82_00215 [Caulobacteraceae bacterium]|nr:hypothetical protein [Caulobacteraceae bacterium]
MTSILREAPSKTKKLYDDLAEIKAAFRYSDTSLWKEAGIAYRNLEENQGDSGMSNFERLPQSVQDRIISSVGGGHTFYTLDRICYDEIKPEPEILRSYTDVHNSKFRKPGALEALKNSFLNIDKTLRAYIKGMGTAQATLDKEFEKKAEEPPNSILGSFAFAEEREDVPFEKDNAEEKKLYSGIEKHIFDNIPLNDERSKLIKKILDKGQYKKLFREPRGRAVYRGMKVSEAWLKKALKLGKKDTLKRKGRAEASFTFTPRRGDASSWASDHYAAEEFAFEGSEDGFYGVILHALSEDNAGRLLDFKNLYDLGDLGEYQHESEVIGFGKIKVYKIEWSSMDIGEDDY